MPEFNEGYFKKESEMPIINPAEIKNPEPDSLIEHWMNDADIDEIIKKKISKADDPIKKFDVMEAGKIINYEFAKLKKKNNGNESYRDEEYGQKILEVAEIIVEEDNVSTKEATLEAIALCENGNVRMRKKSKLRVVK